jgi:hypothetical protein
MRAETLDLESHACLGRVSFCSGARSTRLSPAKGMHPPPDSESIGRRRDPGNGGIDGNWRRWGRRAILFTVQARRIHPARETGTVKLINWLWLEELLLRSCEAEIEAFGAAYPAEPFFACCLEFDGMAGEIGLSYGSRVDVEDLAARRRSEGEEVPNYRALELQPQHWRYRRVRMIEEDEARDQADGVLRDYVEAVQGDDTPEVTEFLWLRFEYLAECVVQRLLDRDSFRWLNRERQFLAYAATEHESLEELEDRILKQYPTYRRATAEMLRQTRAGTLPPQGCHDSDCPSRGRFRRVKLQRCTYCQAWFCTECGARHRHAELTDRLPFFIA